MTRKFATLLSLGALLIGANASAASLSLVSNPSQLTVGSPVVITVRGSDFTNLTDGGDFNLTFNSAALQYVSASIVGTQFDSSFFNSTNAGTGLLTGDVLRQAAGSVGPGPFDVAYISFNVLAGLGASTTLGVVSGLVGWFEPGGLVPYSPVSPGSLTLSAVPAPPAIWLLATAVGGLAARRLRQKAAA